MKGLAVCYSLDHFFFWCPFNPSKRHPHHPQEEKEKQVSLGGRKGMEQDSKTDIHTRCAANSSTCKALTNQ